MSGYERGETEVQRPGNDLDHQGTEKSDDLRGNEGNEHFRGGVGDDLIDGGSGLDEATYAGKITDYHMTRTNGILDVYDSVISRDGHDRLSNVERLSFADGKIAYDLDSNQSAGKSALLISTILGSSGLQNKQVVSAAMNYFDAQTSTDLLSAIQLLQNNGTVANLAGGKSDADIVRWVGHNVLGNKFTSEIEHNCQTYTETHGQADFIATVASMGLNVDLVGLQATGLQYL